MKDSTQRFDVAHRIAVLNAVFAGSGNWVIAVWVLGFGVSVNLFSTDIHEMLQGQAGWHHLTALLLPALTGLLYFKVSEARKSLGPLRVRVEEPVPHRALILFLSLKQQDEVDKVRGDINDSQVRGLLTGSWRMPIEAIHHHLPRLEYVVFLPSSDSPLGAGTYPLADDFKALVSRLVDRRTPPLQVLSLADVNEKWQKGVGFEDAEDLIRALEDVYSWLRTKQVWDHEVMLDVTGGQKVTTAVGAAVALAPQRSFQYVSTRGDYRVRSFDLTYEPDAANKND